MTELLDLYLTNTGTLYPNQTEYSDVVIRLYGRTRSGEAKQVTVTGFEPYFYARAEEREAAPPAEIESLVRYEETDTIPLRDRFAHITPWREATDLVKVVVDKPGDVPEVREHFSKTWGADVIFTERFRIDHGIRTGVRIPVEDNPARLFEVDHSEVAPVEITDVQPRVVTLDIETDDRDTGFPDPGDARILSIVAHDSYEDKYVAFLDVDGESLTSKFDCEDPPESLADLGLEEVDKLNYDQNERQMFTSFADWLENRDPDIVCGWNSGDDSTDGFDLPHIIERMARLNANPARLSRAGGVEVTEYGEVEIDGRSCYDLMDGWEDTKFTNPRSTRLDFVAQKTLDDAKIEHPGMGYFEMYLEDPALFLDYNAKDTRLTVEITEEEGVIPFKKRLKDMIGVDWERTHENNEFIEMSVRRKCHEHGLAMVTVYDNEWVQKEMESDNDDVNYEGAYVFPSFSGVLRNVCATDLASLYPMTQWMLNASPDARIDRQKAWEHDISHVVAENGQCFRNDVDGIIRELVDEYHQIKKEFKAKRNAAEYGTDEWEKAAEAYNVCKTAYNSYYGFSGWARSPLYNPHDAAAITLTGQRVIKRTADYIGEEVAEGVEVVYGDSVPHFEPVYVRVDGEVDIRPIESVYNDLKPGTFEVWADDGWTTCNDVIRKPNRKQMYRVRTANGLVHVTEDHGLLRADGTEVSPTEVEPGDHLLHTSLRSATGITSDLSLNKAWLYGLLAADGTAKGSQFKVCKNDTDLLDAADEMLKSCFDFDTEIRDYRDSSGVQQLRSGDNERGAVTDLCSTLEPKLYTPDGDKRVPKAVLNGSPPVMKAFLDGYQAGDGDDDERYDKRFHRSFTNSHTLGAGITYILDRLEQDAGVNVRDNHGTEYPRIHSREDTGCRAEVLEVEPIEYDGEYVYDLSTESEHFNAGIGRLTVHNTDSNYVQFPDGWGQKKTLKYASQLCEELSEEVYPEFCREFNIPPENNRWEIEVEMRAERMFQDSNKKRYAYLKTWDEGDDFDEVVNEDGDVDLSVDVPDSHGKFSVTGFHCVKSNFALITKEVQEEVLEVIVRGGDKDDVSAILHEAAAGIDADDPDWVRLGMPQGLGKKLDEEKADQDGYYAFTGGTPKSAHPRGAYFANGLLDVDFGQGSNPVRAYLRPTLRVEDANGTPANVDVIGYETEHDLEPVRDDLEMDVSAMQEKVLRNPMEDICDAMGLDVDAALEGQTQTGLGMFE
jgi:DNA polymerase elongation subunit (family B)